MGSWFCIWDDLLRLFAIARVANPNNGLNLVPLLPHEMKFDEVPAIVPER